MSAALAVVQSPSMTGYEPGIRNRRAIVLELHRRELANEDPPSLRDLGRLLSISHITAREHLESLEASGMITRTAGKPNLTDCGRAAAEFIEIGG